MYFKKKLQVQQKCDKYNTKFASTTSKLVVLAEKKMCNEKRCVHPNLAMRKKDQKSQMSLHDLQ